jgi:hypothetical protein
VGVHEEWLEWFPMTLAFPRVLLFYEQNALPKKIDEPVPAAEFLDQFLEARYINPSAAR